MMELIDDVFATRSDKNQLQVTAQDLKKLEEIHASTLSELSDKDGPTTWVLMIPTSEETMEDFLVGKIGENQILENVQAGQKFNCIYLCSATTLPEFRGKGNTKKLSIEAIKSISEDHPIKTLYVWPFTEQGKKLAESIALECGMNLRMPESFYLK